MSCTPTSWADTAGLQECDGNKRTGLNAALVFLLINGWLVLDPDGRLYDKAANLVWRLHERGPEYLPDLIRPENSAMRRNVVSRGDLERDDIAPDHRMEILD